jgi:ABC-type amino acid transport substrate-binding protein
MFLKLPLAVAVPKGKHAELLVQLNAGITAIRADGTWQQINDLWMKKIGECPLLAHSGHAEPMSLSGVKRT